jgi:predicted nucleic acid-binding protein
VDVALSEGLNVIWKHAILLKDLELEDVNSAVEDLNRVYDGLNVIRAREIADESMQVAITQKITVYDSMYIAAAQKMNSTLYSADQKLCACANQIANTKVLKSKE